MSHIERVITGLCLLAVTSAACALDCKQAASPIEKSICNQTDLLRMDDDLNHLYGAVRSQLTARARVDFLAQQRAWLAGRNHDCVNADPECLRAAYKKRLEQLEALNASAQSSDNKLDDPTPVIVKGKWKVIGVQDSAGVDKTDDKGLHDSLQRAVLPELGAVVDALPGKLCLTPRPCDSMGWTRETLSSLSDAEAIGRYLHLNQNDNILAGSSGDKNSFYVLVPRSDGRLWLVFALCSADLRDCRKAAEIWAPASADAAVLIGR